MDTNEVLEKFAPLPWKINIIGDIDTARDDFLTTAMRPQIDDRASQVAINRIIVDAVNGAATQDAEITRLNAALARVRGQRDFLAKDIQFFIEHGELDESRSDILSSYGLRVIGELGDRVVEEIEK